MRYVLIGALMLCWQGAMALGPEWVGRRVPDFALPTIDGKTTLSLRSLRGAVVVIDFWATWCQPCQRTLPALSALASGTPGLRVVAVNIDDDRTHAEEFLRSHGVRLLAVYDEGKQVAKSYDIPEMPSALIIDKEGIVRFVHAGYTERDLDAFRREIAAIQGGHIHD